ncbi:g9778 [Coccomyxa viridis]|uniref:Small ubiquitin-related modifier n=1 Tax=Coccomyxa viridis TaxID=1274662 RepID=A0ABP1G3P3_9CHLO
MVPSMLVLAGIQDSCAGPMTEEKEDVKVKPEVASNVINIVVKDQNSGEVHFKVKPTTKFSKIFDAYAGKKGVEAANIKFLHDGQRIRDHQTPGELGIEDNDVIDCLLEQVGGTLS